MTSRERSIKAQALGDDNSAVPASAIELSSRPERSVVEGPAVSFAALTHPLKALGAISLSVRTRQRLAAQPARRTFPSQHSIAASSLLAGTTSVHLGVEDAGL